MITVLLIAAAAAAPSLDSDYAQVEREYVLEFLRRHPVVSTYLGGSGFDASLAEVDGKLRDWSPPALEAEARFYEQIRDKMQKLPPARLTPAHRIDREIVLHQIAFMLRHTQQRKYWRRSVDTYVNEAFRGLDWYMQGMSEQGGGRYGTEDEWRRVIARVQAVPAYLKQAQANLDAGRAAGDTPDWRMVEKDGIAASEANALFFEKELPAQAAARIKGQAFEPAVQAELGKAGAGAGAAFRELRAFLEKTLAPLPKTDRFALGETEYDWSIRNNLALDTTAARLWEEAPKAIQATRDAMIATARRVAEKRGRKDLAWDEKSRDASTRAVMDMLSLEYPRSDEEMIRGYREVGARLVEFGRKAGLFDIPADYKLDVTVVPPALESAIESAAYYPAPTFKDAGVGRFYVAPTHGDEQELKDHNKAAMASLAAHEGFPGHDWHYKVMTGYREAIGPVRWLTPGEVEGSSSMWQDSVAAEGWGLYTEHLVSEPAPGTPNGFYTDEERLYQLRAQLHRDLRVRLDTGLHTGRLKFDEAVDLQSATRDFLPGSCAAAALSPEKKESCRSAQGAILRYSKWPTQAITYRLGKQQILALRGKAEKIAGGADGRKRFHLLFMKQGTIPPGYFEKELLDELAAPPR